MAGGDVEDVGFGAEEAIAEKVEEKMSSEGISAAEQGSLDLLVGL